MNTQFPLSVRAIPMAAFAAAAIVAGVLKDWTGAAWMALPFVLFAAWPTRMAFTYRAVARWTRVMSVTNPEQAGSPAGAFADYDPKAADLLRAYALNAVWIWPLIKSGPQVALTVAGILLAGGLALWWQGRSL